MTAEKNYSTMTKEELEEDTLQDKVDYAIWALVQLNEPRAAEFVRELNVRYKTVKIQANNYKKALEALDHASKQ